MMRTIALLYHDVVPEGQQKVSGFQGPDADIYKLTIEEFRRHLDEIGRSALHPPTVVTGINVGVDTLVLLTFDDGGLSATLYTADLLEQKGWRGHFFITTDAVGTAGFLSEADLKDLHRRGHVIGSHSCSHPARISHCSREQLHHEWAESVRKLSEITGEPVTTASVPAGYYTRTVAVAAANAGIRTLFTSEPVTSLHIIQGCTILGRFSIRRGRGAEWVGSVVAGEVLPRFRQYLFWNGKKVLRAAGGELWLELRRKILARQAEAD